MNWQESDGSAYYYPEEIQKIEDCQSTCIMCPALYCAELYPHPDWGEEKCARIIEANKKAREEVEAYQAEHCMLKYES